MMIYQQIFDASQQITMGARELLTATILEAALRTIYDQPFNRECNSRKDKFDLSNKLKKFREDYLSTNIELGRKWKSNHKQIIQTHRRLRDRNAHPDWIQSEGGGLSNVMEEAVNDLIFLTSFYGYMILALAGVKDLYPRFPVPFSQWEPILTISRKGKP